MSLAIQLVGAALLVLAGAAGGWRAHVGVVAERDLSARELTEADRREQRAAVDHASSRHAATVANLQSQLGAAREQIARLPGRACLDAGTVRMLNATGHVPDGAPAGAPADPAPAAATDGDERAASDQDVARALAICRTRHGELASQLSAILDVEDRRFPPAAASP